MHNKKHRFHLLALISPVIILIPLILFTRINPIYSSIIAMFIGGIAAMLCRSDLKKKILVGGLIFFMLYFISFILFNLIYPGFVLKVWNLSALSGILIIGVPLEEIIFAFTFGMLWSSVYEHFKWYKLKKEVTNE